MEKGSQQGLLISRAAQRIGDRAAQVQDMTGHEVGQVGVLGAVPYLFVGVEFGGVGGQPFDRQAPSPKFCFSSLISISMDQRRR